MQKLSDKQKKFADYYIQTGNAADSYKKAGYKVNGATARANASRMLTNANIKTYIEERNQEMASSRIADMEEIKEFWTKIVRDETGECLDIRDRLKASELIAKTNGAFITKIEDNEPREIIVTMSDEIKEWGG